MRRRLPPLFLGMAITAAAFAWWPDISRKWSAISGAVPPITIPEAEARWIDERRFDITAPSFRWADSCTSIWVTWWLHTRNHGNVLVESSEAITGPFAQRGKLPPNYRISIEPLEGPPLHLRVTIPEWLDRDEVHIVAVDDVVPDNEPCASGWSGVMEVLRLQIEPQPNLPEVMGP